MLSPCSADTDCESPDDMLCQDGLCRMKINKYCFVNNERLGCLAVCEGKAVCTSMNVIKTDFIN